MFRYPLDGSDILRRRRALKRELLSQGDFISKRIALLSGSTIGEIKGVLELFLLDNGIKPVFFEGAYNRYSEELTFENPGLTEFSPDIIYIHSGVRNIDNMPVAGEDEATVRERLSAEWEKIEAVLIGAKAYGCPVITNNFEYPSVRILGNREAYDPSGKIRFVLNLNIKLADFARDNDYLLINDVNYLSGWFGLEKWADPSYYNAYKYALSPDAIPLLCLSLSSIIKSVFGKNKKALMLDLDDTLWGGTIGDDGVEGIKLGAESPEGMAFSDLQRYAKELRGVGILLGALSKNEESAAVSGFSHPSSVLSRDDFSVFFADWNQKPDNIATAAKELNMGSDFFVFADDNPFERDLMESAGLGVEVAAYTVAERLPETLSMSGYFEASVISEDDLSRAAMYREDVGRRAERTRFSSYDDYLKSLEMKAYISSFTTQRQQRITQLINKTNQFNPTTKRYTPEEISSIQDDPNYIKLAVRLEDKFGDNGIVSVLIARANDKKAVIELFIMSCRVFERGLEYAVFDELVRQSKALGISELEGVYLETKKNAAVKELYPSLGFDEIGAGEGGMRFLFKIADCGGNMNLIIEVVHEQE
ncbi:MAG: HAD-IIIC family phosphatase [Oscillospiraceae bacterium]|nr:HAD-IIIC family phosphatase [Oscillospiraceae bacterium]